MNSAKELEGATICVQPGTTTEQNLTDWARANNIRFQPVVIDRLEGVVGAYLQGRCDAFTTDVSGLASTRAAQGSRSEEHVILPEVISKEPLGPAVRHGDQRFVNCFEQRSLQGYLRGLLLRFGSRLLGLSST